MDTQSGQYGNDGGWQWDGTRWVPVSPHSSDSQADPQSGSPAAGQGHTATPASDFPPPVENPGGTSVTSGWGPTTDQSGPGTGRDEGEATLPGVHPGDSPPGTAPNAGQPGYGQQPGYGSGNEPGGAPYYPQYPGGPVAGVGGVETPAQPHEQAPPPFSTPPSMSAPPFSTSAPPDGSMPGATSAPPAYGQPPAAMPLPPGFGPEGAADPAQVPPTTPVSSAPPGPAHVSAPPGPGHVSAPPGPAQYGPAAAAPPPQQTYQPQQNYAGSGLTAADLTWSEPDSKGKGRVWKVIGAVVGVLVLLAGAAAGGYFFRDIRGGEQPNTPPASAVAGAEEIQSSLGKDGFECGAAYTEPVPVDLCYRDTTEYRDTVGFQMLDAERIGWVKLRVESTEPAEHPVKERALELYRSVLDQALIAKDANAAYDWVAANLPEDYEKNEYLTHEAGGVRLQLLPRAKQSVLLWVRLTAAAYQPTKVESVPKTTPDALEEYYKGEDFSCRPSEGGVNCEKKADDITTKVGYGVKDGKIAALRLQVTPSGKIDEAAPTAKQAAIALVRQILADKRLAGAEKWLQGAFDGKPHHAVLSGLEVRVTPVEIPAEAKAYYEVDVRPADW
ncbi:MAG: hypothetical protein ACRDUA_00120 [Micromonosporaceae bacterium]